MLSSAVMFIVVILLLNTFAVVMLLLTSALSAMIVVALTLFVAVTLLPFRAAVAVTLVAFIVPSTLNVFAAMLSCSVLSGFTFTKSSPELVCILNTPFMIDAMEVTTNFASDRARPKLSL